MDKELLKEREAKVLELAVGFCNEKLDEVEDNQGHLENPSGI